MKEYLIGLWEKFKNTTLIKKLSVVFIMILYIAIVCICLIKVEVDLTSPGSITSVNNVINIESKNNPGNIYTVSVYSRNKVSILEYLLIKLDKNSEISLGVSVTNTIFTETEEYNSNVLYKTQSIQDSIIVAYETAINNGYDVVLDYKYIGECIINFPQNLFGTGAEDIKNGDIVTKINDNVITSSEDYLNYLADLFSTFDFTGKEVKTVYEELEKLEEKPLKFSIIRNNKDTEIYPSYKTLFYLYKRYVYSEKYDETYIINKNHYSSYEIKYENCSPKITLFETVNVGPSGGLLQTLSIYNSITSDDITKGLKIMGTGGIEISGEATIIGGEQQKIITANLYGADVFFIPEENYDSAFSKYKTIKEPSYELVKVEDFNDVLEYLEQLEVKDGQISNSK